MANQIDANGISIDTLSVITDDLVKKMKLIYGDDINTEQNSPDGQWINNIALAKEDSLELAVSVYNSKDPDQAVGVDLDAVSQLCGITRRVGTYTYTDITVTADRAVNLVGLDESDSPFTVSDDNGNLFYLLESVSIASAGDNSLAFRAAEVGNVQVTTNTLTTIVTVTLGITAVNNPASPTSVGVDEETDAALRVRRQKSVAYPAQSGFDGLYAALVNVDGMDEVVIYENRTTDDPDAIGVSAKSVWIIVDGGTDEDVAQAIYDYLSMGCGMDGAEEVSIEQVDGSTFTINFDRAVSEDLYIDFDVSSIGSLSIDADAIKAYLVANYTLGIYEPADITAIAALIHEYSSDLVCYDMGVGINGADYYNSIYPSARKNKFNITSAKISITEV